MHSDWLKLFTATNRIALFQRSIVTLKYLYDIDSCFKEITKNIDQKIFKNSFPSGTKMAKFEFLAENSD